MNAKGLQLIPVTEDRFVLKRGVRSVLLHGAGARRLLEPLLTLLDGSRDREEIASAFPGDLRAEIDQLLDVLLQRGLIFERTPEDGADRDGEDHLERAFFENFAPSATPALETLAAAKVVVVGLNLISRSLVQGLLESGVGRVVLCPHPVLDNFIYPTTWTRMLETSPWSDRLDRRLDMPSQDELAEAALLCATCDFGEAEALLEINRLALGLGRPFLPAWLDELLGYVGPLNHPHETACLRCYRLRADSNDTDYSVKRTIRAFMTSEEEARGQTGLLPPMPTALGAVAAMEVGKFLTRYAPGEVVGRQIRLNLVSFQSTVRRVLKVPRCPECSEQTRQAPQALTLGPQIAHRT